MKAARWTSSGRQVPKSYTHTTQARGHFRRMVDDMPNAKLKAFTMML